MVAFSAPSPWLARQADISYQRLLPRLRRHFASRRALNKEWPPFAARASEHFPRLFVTLHEVYGQRYDFFYHLEELLYQAADAWLARPEHLKTHDADYEANPHGFRHETTLGGVCYVELFAGDLAGVQAQIPYFKELGLNYLHLMPLFKAPQPDNDGGYAVSNYREVDPALGSTADLIALANALHENGIALVLDFVFNHTSDEHIWAQQALAGNLDFQDFYFMFPDRAMPDAYEQNLRAVFPDEKPGSFIWRPDIQQWVWATFHHYQWDLNYSNPAVFRAMADEMLHLANIGVDVLRLDAVAFIWKQLGTSCENLPQAHLIIQAYNALMRIAAPSVLFKSEAIVHPDDVLRYISPEECQLSYNPLLMALLWESLATRRVELLQLSMQTRFRIPPGSAWVNYIRCHDDIGWTFADDDAWQLGINPNGHRQFLNAYYTGRFDGSFARGVPFQEDPLTGDARVSGTAASLAGLEKALHEETEAEVILALNRLLLLHSVILSIGGVPLIYLGDEVAMLNDYRYRENPAKAHDSRWVHRPFTDWAAMPLRHQPESIAGRMFAGLHHRIAIRQATPAFAGQHLEVLPLENPHLFGYVRAAPEPESTVGHQRVLIFNNFSEAAQTLTSNVLRLYGLSYEFIDLLTGSRIASDADLTLAPYQVVWLVAA